ncbi:dynamin family protein [Paecilomyces variotii No. 5]|uniref:Dynamin family protein n=1 Tax=Byssochlamys spectabilis (strain No. 5 / NBRC 109023) TaxID=1356009 RepID=V5HUI8_BYSSN|nr:dynamin family protein [Paecilomyces variotii No. 5]
MATIIPHASHQEEEKSYLIDFRHKLRDFAELPEIIEEVAILMGISNFGVFVNAPTFSVDVLRLELVSDTGVHLIIVDLPGLISVSENKEDVELVDNLVCSYLENSRMIILAVVPTSSNIDTQGIIQCVYFYDKDGLRTVGIITKPDLINMGTESRVAQLVKNLDQIKLNLGFFLLKNPIPAQLEEGISHLEWRKIERDFFLSGPWREQGLDPSRIGIENLRLFL